MHIMMLCQLQTVGIHERGQYRSVISRAFPTMPSTMTRPIIVDGIMKEMNENRNIIQIYQRHNQIDNKMWEQILNCCRSSKANHRDKDQINTS